MACNSLKRAHCPRWRIHVGVSPASRKPGDGKSARDFCASASQGSSNPEHLASDELVKYLIWSLKSSRHDVQSCHKSVGGGTSDKLPLRIHSLLVSLSSLRLNIPYCIATDATCGQDFLSYRRHGVCNATLLLRESTAERVDLTISVTTNHTCTAHVGPPSTMRSASRTETPSAIAASSPARRPTGARLYSSTAAPLGVATTPWTFLSHPDFCTVYTPVNVDASEHANSTSVNLVIVCHRIHSPANRPQPCHSLCPAEYASNSSTNNGSRPNQPANTVPYADGTLDLAGVSVQANVIFNSNQRPALQQGAYVEDTLFDKPFGRSKRSCCGGCTIM